VCCVHSIYHIYYVLLYLRTTMRPIAGLKIRTIVYYKTHIVSIIWCMLQSTTVSFVHFFQFFDAIKKMCVINDLDTYRRAGNTFFLFNTSPGAHARATCFVATLKYNNIITMVGTNKNWIYYYTTFLIYNKVTASHPVTRI